jgi:hypothetical protein
MGTPSRDARSVRFKLAQTPKLFDAAERKGCIRWRIREKDVVSNAI